MITSNVDMKKEEKLTATVTIHNVPYVRGISESIRRLLEKVDVKVRMRPYRTLRQILVRPKDPVPAEEKTGVVYRIPCRDCPQAYIGQTGQTLTCRLKEHKRATERGNIDVSAVAEHAWVNNHRVNWEAAEVLEVKQEWYKRCMIESWHIRQEKNLLTGNKGCCLRYTIFYIEQFSHMLSFSLSFSFSLSLSLPIPLSLFYWNS